MLRAVVNRVINRRLRLLQLTLILASAKSEASDWHVATNGTPIGNGTLTQPYDLATALSGAVANPGDTFWLSGGNYVIGHIDTKISGTNGQPITFRPMPGEQVRVNGSLSFFDSPGFVILRNLEFYSSDTNRSSSQTNAGFNPTDITLVTGIASYCPNMSFINLVVHDETGEGIYISHEGINDLIYGCVIYNNGWQSLDNAEGHGIYVQGYLGTREISDNIVFDNSGVCLHVYDNGTNATLKGITLDGNVAYNAGAIQSMRFYRDMIVGVDYPAISADDIVFKNNMGYTPRLAGDHDAAQLGRDGINGSVAILNNYLPQGLEVNDWFIAAVSGNMVSDTSASLAVSLSQSQVALSATWNLNNYFVGRSNAGFLVGTNGMNFSTWQSLTGFDANSTCQLVGLTGLTGWQIFVRTNRYETNRANIVVYNWDDHSYASVDVSSVLQIGTPYEIRNAQDFFAPPVLSGVYDGQPLTLPMNGLTVAVPNGPMITPPPTGPTFNVFVLLQRSVKLQITRITNNQVQLSWPTNSGSWVLQTTTNLASAWVDNPNIPTIFGDQYMTTNAILVNSCFYRLRPQ
jgi:hypothetical protein